MPIPDPERTAALTASISSVSNRPETRTDSLCDPRRNVQIPLGAVGGSLGSVI